MCSANSQVDNKRGAKYTNTNKQRKIRHKQKTQTQQTIDLLNSFNILLYKTESNSNLTKCDTLSSVDTILYRHAHYREKNNT